MTRRLPRPRHPLQAHTNPQTGRHQWSPEDFVAHRLPRYNRVNAVIDSPAPRKREP